MTTLDERFQRAHDLQEKLARYLAIEKELRELERDADLCRLLEIEPPAPEPLAEAADSAAAVEAESAKPEAPTPASATEEPPRSPTGRLPRGFLHKRMPAIAEGRFQDWKTVAEMREILMGELSLGDLERNTVSGAAKRLTAKGKMEMDNSGPLLRFRFARPDPPTAPEEWHGRQATVAKLPDGTDGKPPG